MPLPARPRTRTAVPILLLAAALAGCSGSGASSARSSAGSGAVRGDTAGGEAAAAAPAGPAAGMKAPGAAGGGGTTGATSGKLPPLARPAPDPRSVVYTVQMTVRARDVDAAAAAGSGIATGAGGYVRTLASGGSGSGRNGTATLVLAIPPAGLDAALARLRGLGTQLSINREADDVTESVVDVAARLSAQRASVARIRTLMSRARTVGEVVAVEDQLTQREADLESLQTRQQALDRQVSMSTVTLTLLPVTPARSKSPVKSGGFIAGLHSGWTAFAGATVVLLTVLGAVLPFAVLIALVVAAGLALRRAVTRRRPPPAPAEG